MLTLGCQTLLVQTWIKLLFLACFFFESLIFVVIWNLIHPPPLVDNKEILKD